MGGGAGLVGFGLTLIVGGTTVSSTGVGAPLGVVGTVVGTGAVFGGGVLLINEWNNLINGPQNQTSLLQPNAVPNSQNASICH